jgi:hypothetical protein
MTRVSPRNPVPRYPAPCRIGAEVFVAGVRGRPRGAPQGERNREHETDDHHAGLRRWSDAGKRRRHPLIDPGFERGGWARPLFDSEAMTFVDQLYQRADAFLLFPRNGPDMALDLAESRAFPKGITVKVYRPAGRPRYATT